MVLLVRGLVDLVVVWIMFKGSLSLSILFRNMLFFFVRKKIYECVESTHIFRKANCNLHPCVSDVIFAFSFFIGEFSNYLRCTLLILNAIAEYITL